MKVKSTLFLKAVVVLMGLGALTLCGVLVWAMFSDNTGYYLPILVGMELTAIPFFIALYQAMKLLGYIDSNKSFSPFSTNALKNIKYCAVAIATMYAVGMPYIFYAADRDDAPGAVAIGLIITGASIVIAVFASLLQKILQNAIDIKSENDLTV